MANNRSNENKPILDGIHQSLILEDVENLLTTHDDGNSVGNVAWRPTGGEVFIFKVS